MPSNVSGPNGAASPVMSRSPEGRHRVRRRQNRYGVPVFREGEDVRLCGRSRLEGQGAGAFMVNSKGGRGRRIATGRLYRLHRTSPTGVASHRTSTPAQVGVGASGIAMTGKGVKRKVALPGQALSATCHEITEGDTVRCRGTVRMILTLSLSPEDQARTRHCD